MGRRVWVDVSLQKAISRRESLLGIEKEILGFKKKMTEKPEMILLFDIVDEF